MTELPFTLEQILAEKRRRKFNKIDTMFPATGDLSYSKYKKHSEFFAAGKLESERLFIAANRVGKTVVGAFEVTCHLTGRYPSWWTGRRFDEATDFWAAGNTGETTRDVLQFELLGEMNDLGSGMIPKDCILDITNKRGIPNAVDTVYVKNVHSDKASKVSFKSFDQGRAKFQGTKKHGIWLDEECPQEVYTECLIRTMTTDGLVILTFTPLSGLTPLIQTFIGESFETKGNKFYINATWDDAPHLTKKQRDALWLGIPAYQREARSKGVPSLGSGAIYPIEDSRLEVTDFPIPDHWPRIRGMDTGWNHTACCWIAYDASTNTKYVYSDYKTAQVEPPVHAISINAKGKWISGPCDFSGTNQRDGTKVIEEYQNLDVDVYPAQKLGKEGDIFNTYNEMISGKIKVFKSCSGWFSEKRLYRRNDKGNIVKTDDHIMDAFQYANKVDVNEWSLNQEDEEEEYVMPVYNTAAY